ncbi:MAG: hypothetical protein HY305_01240 [Sphingobacteriales bacterium]|nr:hypothetical protein [Sphingobacteriales bacterium]
MQIVLVLHNLVRWAILLFGVWTLINAITGVINKRPYTVTDSRTNLFFMISCDIQLLLGLSLYFSLGWFERLKDLGANMKDPYSRFFTVEHMSFMLLAWILVHVGRTIVKKTVGDDKKHKKSLLFFGLVIILILAAMPWPFREAIARPWFRF